MQRSGVRPTGRDALLAFALTAAAVRLMLARHAAHMNVDGFDILAVQVAFVVYWLGFARRRNLRPATIAALLALIYLILITFFPR